MNDGQRWLTFPIPLPDGQVAYLAVTWPLSWEDLEILNIGLQLNLTLAQHVAKRKAEEAAEHPS